MLINFSSEYSPKEKRHGKAYFPFIDKYPLMRI